MENSGWEVSAALITGVISSFLQPLDKPVPMVATTNVGHVAAELLQETWIGRRTIELEGPTRELPTKLRRRLPKSSAIRFKRGPFHVYRGKSFSNRRA